MVVAAVGARAAGADVPVPDAVAEARVDLAEDRLRWLVPDWPAPANVRAAVSLRSGGDSLPPYASLNLGSHVGDAPEAVARNRQRLCTALALPRQPQWLRQIHGTNVVHLPDAQPVPIADACWTDVRGIACAILTADCLPVLLCDREGRVVGAAHAGWRGLCAGVLEETVATMGIEPARLLAWIGPGIGPGAFEVGPEVRAAFLDRYRDDAECFVPSANDGRWMADLAALAARRLRRCGVGSVTQSGACTHRDPERFFSYRRDGETGRFVSLIWLAQD